MIGRRAFIEAGLAGLAATSALPRIAFARTGGARRFVFVILRGAADGLHLVPPLGDPGFEGLRAPFMASLEGAHRCDGTFSLHPALEAIARLYAAGQAAICPAVATGYRERSHFDAQNILETGARQAYADKTGWMNRLAGLLPAGESSALALAASIPAALRGGNPVSSYAPSRFDSDNDALMSEVATLYGGDPQLSALWDAAMQTRGMIGMAGGGRARRGADVGALAAKLLLPDDGARLMTIESTGWDMHSRQLPHAAAKFAELDATVGALVAGLGPVWQHTMVLVATEFGRTAAVNGTAGTDHGTGSAALLLGGSLRGGRIIGDWPGLAPRALFASRDLQPVMAMEALVSGAAAHHFGLDPRAAARALYPAWDGLQPVSI